jgi:sulfatase maturation enzyme AslB (radical SAM superfamily)
VITDRCSHKSAWSYGGFNGSHEEHMSIEAMTVILEKMRAIGIVQVTLAGGEPTEHPEFRAAVATAHGMGFLIHIASHGEHIDQDLATYLAAHGVRQVQLNFQGERFHDSVHGVAGSHRRQREGIRALLSHGIEVTTTTTVGRYNLAELESIFREAAALGVSRLRIWETTGRGNPWLKGVEAAAIFETARDVAMQFGYTHTLSYDPAFEGDVSVPCLQFSNLYMYITRRGILRFCGAVVGGAELEIVDCVTADADEILRAYLEFNRRAQGGRKVWCPARSGWADDSRHDPAMIALPVMPLS